jgi:hypothetical protein
VRYYDRPPKLKARIHTYRFTRAIMSTLLPSTYELKKCRGCCKLLTLDRYYSRIYRGTRRYDNDCRKCKCLAQRERLKHARITAEVLGNGTYADTEREPDMHKCRTCGELLPFARFRLCVNSRNGVTRRMLSCRSCDVRRAGGREANGPRQLRKCEQCDREKLAASFGDNGSKICAMCQAAGQLDASDSDSDVAPQLTFASFSRPTMITVIRAAVTLSAANLADYCKISMINAKRLKRDAERLVYTQKWRGDIDYAAAADQVMAEAAAIVID